MKNVVRVENGSMIFGQGGSGGSGGHTIQNDSGTALPQESALQFVGVYSEDDSTNGKTKVNIIREMTKAQMDALSSDAKKGVIHTTDEADNPISDNVKVGTVSGTTSSSGNLVTNLKVSEINIIGARCTNVSGAITMVAEIATDPLTYAFHVANFDGSMTALVSTAVQIEYFYL